MSSNFSVAVHFTEACGLIRREIPAETLLISKGIQEFDPTRKLSEKGRNGSFTAKTSSGWSVSAAAGRTRPQRTGTWRQASCTRSSETSLGTARGASAPPAPPDPSAVCCSRTCRPGARTFSRLTDCHQSLWQPPPRHMWWPWRGPVGPGTAAERGRRRRLWEGWRWGWPPPPLAASWCWVRWCWRWSGSPHCWFGPW